MANNNDFSSIFWNGIVAGAILYFLTDSFELAAIAAIAAMLIIWLLKRANRQPQQQEEQIEQAYEIEKEYAFDFDSLSPTYKSQLLKQQFSYFFAYRSLGNNRLEFYCAEDELDGYRFSFWIDYSVDNNSSNNIVRVKEGDPICIVYVSSNKGRAFGYEQFTIRASVDGVVSGFHKGTLQKNGVIFRLKSGNEEELDAAMAQEIPQAKSTVFFEDIMEDLSIENENIVVEKLEDVLKWEMPDVDDIEMPEEEGNNSAYDASVAYHATITNLSDFDWCNFKAVCYSSKDETQKEVKRIGNVKIGTKTLLSSRFDMFYLEGENANGEQKRFRPFALEKDSDITITTIFIERN